VDIGRVSAVGREGQRFTGSGQGVLDGGHGHFQDAGRFFGAPAEDIAQDQGGALPGRKAFQKGDKSQADIFSPLPFFLRRCRGSYLMFGIDFVQRIPIGLAALDVVYTKVVRDLIEPCACAGPGLEGFHRFEGAYEHLLRQVFRFRELAGKAVAIGDEFPSIGLCKGTKGGSISLACAGEIFAGDSA